MTRENYRSLDKGARDADTSYADSLSDVVDAIASNPQCRTPADQLADDLSGRYGPFAINWRSVDSSTEVVIEGEILSDSGDPLGNSVRSFYRDHDGYLGRRRADSGGGRRHAAQPRGPDPGSLTRVLTQGGPRRTARWSGWR